MIEYVVNPISAVLLALFLVSVWKGEQSFIIADQIISALVAITIYLFPRSLLWLVSNIEYSEIDNLSIHLHTILGAIFVAHLVFGIWTTFRGDFIDKEAFMRVRLIQNMLTLLAMIYAQLHYVEWTLRYIQLGLLGLILWTLPCWYFFFAFTTAGGTTTPGYETSLQLDFLVGFTVGLACYAFPQWLFKLYVDTSALDAITTSSIMSEEGSASLPFGIRPNGMNIHLIRLLGSMLMGSSIQSYFSLYYSSYVAKKVILLGRVLGGILILLAIILCKIWPNASTGIKPSYFLYAFLGIILWCVNALAGIMSLTRRERSDQVVLGQTEGAAAKAASEPSWVSTLRNPSGLSSTYEAGSTSAEQNISRDYFSYSSNTRVGIFATGGPQMSRSGSAGRGGANSTKGTKPKPSVLNAAEATSSNMAPIPSQSHPTTSMGGRTASGKGTAGEMDTNRKGQPKSRGAGQR